MNFIEKILDGLMKVIQVIIDGFMSLIDLIAKPLSYLFYFFDGVFYFIMVLFDVVVKVIMIFVALFQFIGSLIMGFFRTIQSFLTPTFTQPVNMPSNSEQGLNVVLDVIDPIGVLTIVPYICVAFVWFGFIMKTLALFGGQLTAKGGN